MRDGGFWRVWWLRGKRLYTYEQRLGKTLMIGIYESFDGVKDLTVEREEDWKFEEVQVRKGQGGDEEDTEVLDDDV